MGLMLACGARSSLDEEISAASIGGRGPVGGLSGGGGGAGGAALGGASTTGGVLTSGGARASGGSGGGTCDEEFVTIVDDPSFPGPIYELPCTTTSGSTLALASFGSQAVLLRNSEEGGLEGWSSQFFGDWFRIPTPERGWTERTRLWVSTNEPRAWMSLRREAATGIGVESWAEPELVRGSQNVSEGQLDESVSAGLPRVPIPSAAKVTYAELTPSGKGATLVTEIGEILIWRGSDWENVFWTNDPPDDQLVMDSTDTRVGILRLDKFGDLSARILSGDVWSHYTLHSPPLDVSAPVTGAKLLLAEEGEVAYATWLIEGDYGRTAFAARRDALGVWSPRMELGPANELPDISTNRAGDVGFAVWTGCEEDCPDSSAILAATWSNDAWQLDNLSLDYGCIAAGSTAVSDRGARFFTASCSKISYILSSDRVTDGWRGQELPRVLSEAAWGLLPSLSVEPSGGRAVIAWTSGETTRRTRLAWLEF
jgi:hypothetical protein